tara:strand:- start:1281 stop:1841 length:561 start_codon:yes stop_codon:yes gene_type:complete
MVLKNMRSLFILVTLVFSGTFFAESTMECNFNTDLSGALDEKISAYRDKAFPLCLTCEGNSCKMNVFSPETDPDSEKQRLLVTAACKRYFCTPKKFRKVQGEEIPADQPNGKSSFEFTYKISSKGRVRDIEITSVEGVMNRRDAYRWTQMLTKRVIYLPVEVNGKTYEITNLSAKEDVIWGVFDGD